MTLDDLPRRRLLTAVFLISVASLALEVLQIRMFAYALWQHLAFLVISIAMLGFGAAGSVLAASGRLRDANLGNALAVAALLFTATALIGPYYLAEFPIDIFQQIGQREILTTGLYYLLFSSPFFFAGYMVAMAFTRASGSIGPLYGANMLGSGIGCFVIFFTLMPLGAGGSLFVLAGIGAGVAALTASAKALRGLGATVAVVLFATSPFIEPESYLNKAWYQLRFKPASSKMLVQMWAAAPEGELALSKWTPLCRIDVLRREYDGVLVQDGDAGAPLWRNEAPMLARDLTHVPHLVVDEPDVLIIGSGAGRELQTALERGAKSITGAEINPVTVEVCLDPDMTVVQKKIDQYPGRIRIENAEGRYFVRSSDKKYDLITMTGVDTYTALVSGAYVVSESYLYTKDAILDFYDHLTDDGAISYVRWAFPTPRETLKTMVMACQALRERGVERPWEHVAVIRNARDDSPWTSATILACTLIKKSPFTEEERAALHAFASEHTLMPEYIPGDAPRFSEEQLADLQTLIAANPLFEEYPLNEDGVNPFHAYATAVQEGREAEFLDEYPYNVRAVTDDRPFFFNQHYFSSLWNWLLGRGPDYEVEESTWMGASRSFDLRPTGMILLSLTLVQLLVLSAVAIFGPLVFLRRDPGARRGGFAVPILYFMCLGFAYIFLMMSSIQRFGLVLGHPSYAISVTMATFLVSSGVGSLLSGRFAVERGKTVVAAVAAVLVAATIVLQVAMPSIKGVVLGQPFGMRVLITVLVLSPQALVMGLCFPMGLRALRERNESLIPWAYAVNGSASVLGSVLAVVLAMALGFTAVQWISSLLYVTAAVAIARMLAGVRSAPAA